MAMTESDLVRAEKRMADRLAGTPVIVEARYNPRRKMLEVHLSNGLILGIPPGIIQDLAGASSRDLSPVEIDAAGLSLHWPKLDADLYLPGLLEGHTGSRRWMAGRLGAKGGAATSKAKGAAARRNGRLGGRPRKEAAA
jgi:hypothetical protein